MIKELSTTQQLNLPFEYDEYGINYEGAVYVSQQSIADRLNNILGIENWELEPVEININMDTYSVCVLAKLSVYDASKDRWISRTQYGNDTMTILQGEQQPRAQAIEDAKKSAISDSLKKCASWLGCASDVFKGKVKCIKAHKNDRSDNPLYMALIQNFGLNSFDYKYGLVILPDSYKAYYEEQGWNGIFESDLANAFSFGGSKPNAGQTSEQQAAGGQERDQQGSTNTNTNRGGNRSGNSKSNGNGNTNSSSSTGSNSPQQLRIKALSAPKFNQDGTAIFDAMLQSSDHAAVIVPKELAQEAVNVIAKDLVLHVKGWLNENTGVIKLAKNSKITVERQDSKAS
ncbi:Rad52/Rad22 family DNA repair protein [Paenibacillus aestuarii]|uniref:Rad52/Rad22 family DNA repair protein n=1 Tax=Paenibacillus aestuarii TaxID=516965 RepID=A0ABW0K816_9BACL